MKTKAICTFVVIGLLLCSSCFQLLDQGPVKVVKEFINPGKTKKAVLLIKGGNATSADSFQISINNTGDKLSDTDTGNTFTCDDDHGKAHADSTTIKIKWLGTNELKILYQKHIRTFI